MKIKVRPEDFIVKEILSRAPEKRGSYVLAMIKKRNTNTIDVLRDISRRLGVKFEDISYCGMKDRYSLSYQYVSIPKDQFRSIKAKNYELEAVGYVEKPLSREDLLANEFEITVRDVSLPDDIVEKRLDEVKRWGFVNYYDEQRFGSARHGKGFVVAELMKGNFENALKLYMVEYSRHDDKKIKKWKRLVKEKWRRWDESLIEGSGVYRRILEFLITRPPSKNTFKKAFSFVDDREKTILISAYQSYIWNRVTVELIRRNFSDDDLIEVPQLYGTISFYRTLEGKDYLRDIEIPAISPKMRLEGDLKTIVEEVLKAEGIDGIENFKLPLSGWLFRSYKRRLIVFPEELKYYKDLDEINPGKKKWVLKFRLPSGSFATILLKRIFAV